MQRYFIKNTDIFENKIFIQGNDCHHITNVMRMSLGDVVIAIDEEGFLYQATIHAMNKNQVTLKILEKKTDNRELPCKVTMAMGLTKMQKLEEVIRRITELGASQFIGVEMKYSIIRLNKINDIKYDRWKTIVKEASEQSERNQLMNILPLTTFSSFLLLSKNYDLCLYAYEEFGKQKNIDFKQLLDQFNGKSILVLVGPEGGISPEEVNLLDHHGFKAIGLGPRILRCETAPLYIMSAISYSKEFFNEG